MYQTSCESFTGYTIPEFSSSGMTHNMGMEFRGFPKWMKNIKDVWMDPNYSIMRSFIDYNYGHISVDKD